MDSDVFGIILVVAFYAVVVPALLAFWYRRKQVGAEQPPLSDRDDFYDGWRKAGRRLDLAATDPPAGLRDVPKLRGRFETLPVTARLVPQSGSEVNFEFQLEARVPFPWQHLAVVDDALTIRDLPLSGAKEVEGVDLPSTVFPKLAERASRLSIEEDTLGVTTPLPSATGDSSAAAFTDHIETLTDLTDRLVQQGVLLELAELPRQLSLRVRIEPATAAPSETVRVAVVVDLEDHWPLGLTVESTGNLAADGDFESPGAAFDELFEASVARDVDDELRTEFVALLERFDNVELRRSRLEVDHLLESADDALEQLDESIERAGGTTLELIDLIETPEPSR